MKSTIKQWNPAIPCLNVTVEGSVKAVAIINIIGCILCALMVTHDIITREGFHVEYFKTSENTSEMIQILPEASLGQHRSNRISATNTFHYLTWTLLYLKDAVDFIVSIFLFKACKERNFFYCKLYFYSTFVVLLAYAVYLVDITILRLTYAITVSVVIGFCFHIFYKPYSVWVILNFMKIVKKEDKESEEKHNSRRLTQEVEKFYKGSNMLSPINLTLDDLKPDDDKLSSGVISLDGSYTKGQEISPDVPDPILPNPILSDPPMRHEAFLSSFNKKYELQRSDFTIDESSILGSGEFGSVCRGELVKIEPKRSVAVKTTKCSESDLQYFKALLDEVKVMCDVGVHHNIVNLIGVCTEEIANQQLWIVMELCEKGSLDNYLKNNRSAFKVNPSKSNRRVRKSPEYMKHITQKLDDVTLSMPDLVTWAHEIGLGMEFLVQKKVYHGDLALRNILLTGNRKAKIADFGLARKLYNYVLYARDEETALPWRWMAPESLRNLTFSEKTDVWTYGVTLWEMFSLGEIPWSKYEYGPEFVAAILGGAKLQCPTHCPTQMYAIMEGCWSLQEDLRPTFSQLNFHTQVLFKFFDNLTYSK